MSETPESSSDLTRRALLQRAAVAGALATPAAGLLATSPASGSDTSEVPLAEAEPQAGTTAGPGEFRGPQGISVDSTGKIVVTDSGNERLQVFDSNGTFQFQVTPLSDADTVFPVDSAVDGNDRIIVLNGYRVQVYNAQGQFQFAFGSAGAGPAQFAGPSALTVDSQNNIIVLDSEGHQVKVFDQNGLFRFKFGSLGSGNGQLNTPLGIAVDGSNNIVVRSNVVRPESHPFYEKIGYERKKTQHVYARSLGKHACA